MSFLRLLVLAALSALISCTTSMPDSKPVDEQPQSVELDYPTARRGDVVDVYFGTEVPALYRWMEDLDDPELQSWIRAQNALTESYLSKIPVRHWIRQRLTELWNYPKQGTPDQLANGMLFFSRNAGLQNQAVVYVQESAAAEARVLLDPNKRWPEGTTALSFYVPSPRGKYLAYALSEGGSDWNTLHVLNVRTGEVLSDTVRWVKFSGLSWTEDGEGFFYSRYPTPPEDEQIATEVVNQKLYYHTLGTPQSEDVLIFELPERPRWLVGGGVSEDGRYLLIYAVDGTSPNNELYYADLGDPLDPAINAEIQPLYTKNDAEYSPVGIVGETLYLKTTLDAPRGRIVAADIRAPAPDNWRVVVPEGEGVLAGAAMAGGHILTNHEIVAKSRLRLFDTGGALVDTLDLPTLGTVGGISARRDSDRVYYAFTSFLYPTTLYRYDVASGATRVYFKPEVAFDAAPYETRQVLYTSKDGTEVPMFIVAKKGIELDGSHPAMLYAYGGFNVSITPDFDPILPVWLELGGVYAVANIRGGGEYGEAWHKAGMLGNKQNVFDDFAWAAKYLIEKGYTSSDSLGIQGYSNGGLLVGASITQRPALFGAAYAGAGVLDMLRYQEFSGGALWAPEYGTSDNPQAFKWLYAYSPLHNIEQGTCYPPTIVTTADHDDRVVPSHSYKFVAAMQRAQGCGNPILLRVTTDTSHGYMPTDKRIAQIADIWTFQAYHLGVKEVPGGSE